jgi:hypothetical protein
MRSSASALSCLRRFRSSYLAAGVVSTVRRSCRTHGARPYRRRCSMMRLTMSMVVTTLWGVATTVNSPRCLGTCTRPASGPDVWNGGCSPHRGVPHRGRCRQSRGRRRPTRARPRRCGPVQPGTPRSPCTARQSPHGPRTGRRQGAMSDPRGAVGRSGARRRTRQESTPRTRSCRAMMGLLLPLTRFTASSSCTPTTT